MPSRKQENVAGACSGATESVNVAVVLSVVAGGPVIVVVGAPTTIQA